MRLECLGSGSKSRIVQKQNLTMAKEYKITEQGSLGLLALGHVGLRKWREVVAEEKKKRAQEKKDAEKK